MTTDRKMDGRRRGASYAALFFAVFCVGCGPILALVADAHPLVKCAYRFALASCVIAPISFFYFRGEIARLTKRDALLLFGAGASMCVHFSAWIAAIDFTSVASAIVLADTAPVWTALILALIGRGAPNRRKVLSIALSLIGAAVVGYSDLSFSREALIGDGIALVSAIGLSGYFICGSELRHKLSATPYSALCYSVGAAIMWAIVLCMGLKVSGFDARTWGALVGMTVVAQLLGHMLYNWALGVFSAGFVSMAVLGEPVCSAVMAAILFDQIPSPTAAIGMVVLLISIAIAAREE